MINVTVTLTPDKLEKMGDGLAYNEALFGFLVEPIPGSPTNQKRATLHLCGMSFTVQSEAMARGDTLVECMLDLVDHLDEYLAECIQTVYDEDV